MECPKCGGRKRIFESDSRGVREYECLTCGGTGEIEDLICPNCSGSGEGMYDGTKCSLCKGSGVYNGY